MALKNTHVAGEPVKASDMNSHASAIIQNEHNIIELFLENFFASKITPFNGLFFDGFSDSTKVDTISGIEVDTTNKQLKFPLDVLGDGADGAKTLSSTEAFDTIKEAVTGAASSGQKDIDVAVGGSFTVGKIVLIHQTQGTGAGNYEFRKIASIASNTLTLEENLSNSYAASGAQVLQPQNFTTVTINSSGIANAAAWNGTVGGVFCFFATGAVTINGTGKIDMQGLGFRGGAKGPTSSDNGQQGESEVGLGAVGTTTANGAGGGGAPGSIPDGGGGGGAGHSVAGSAGNNGDGEEGAAVGVADLSTIFLGAGGGGGANTATAGDGGDGGGIIIVVGESLVMAGGTMIARGNNGDTGASDRGGGGGGAAGSILLLIADVTTLSTTVITALKGAGGLGGTATYDGGDGADGRIAINTDGGTPTGTTNPTFANDGTLTGLFGGTPLLSGAYESITTAFQSAKETVHLWITRNFPSQFNLDAGISGGATTLTIAGDQTAIFANGDTIDISTDDNLVRERKTLTAVPSFGGGVTTLTFSATDNAFGISDFVERVDVIPQVSLVDAGTAKSFVAINFTQSIVDFSNNEVEDEYTLVVGTPQEDLKVKIDITYFVLFTS